MALVVRILRPRGQKQIRPFCPPGLSQIQPFRPPGRATDRRPMGAVMRMLPASRRRKTAVAAAADGVDAIVNFAAETHVDRSILGATDFGRTEFFGTQVLLVLGPLLPLFLGIWRRSELILLGAFPSALLIPISVSPVIASSRNSDPLTEARARSLKRTVPRASGSG